MVLDGRGFVRRDQLRLETRALPVRAVMFSDVKGAHIDNPLRFGDRPGSCILSFQIGFLIFVEVGGMAFKPQINGGFILLHVHVPSFIQQRHNRLVLKRLPVGIGRRNQSAESGKVVFLFFGQRRSREPEIAGIRQHLPHPGGHHAELCPVTFVNEHKNVVVVIRRIAHFQRLIKFMHQRGDNGRFGLNQLRKLAPGGRAFRLNAALPKHIFNLFCPSLSCP